jgi:hypothetical protein
MASEQELYVSVNTESYKYNKSNILKTQVLLLETLKRLHKLRVLSRQKNDLKAKLKKQMTTILSDIKSIQDSTPTPKVPRSIKIHIVENQDERYEERESFSKQNSIENELLAIQEKLRELNN